MRRSHPYPVNPHQDGLTVAAFYGGMAGCSLLIIAVFVALLWVLWPGAARAQTPTTGPVLCAPWSKVKKQFEDKWHEIPVSNGLANGKWILQVIASPDGSTFTVFMIDRLGIACAMASGTGWEPGSNPVQKETRG